MGTECTGKLRKGKMFGAFRYGEVGTHAEGKWRIGNVLKWPESIPIMKKRNPYGSTIKCKKRRPEEQKVKAKWS